MSSTQVPVSDHRSFSGCPTETIGMNHHGGSANHDRISQAWLDAIDDATACLRAQDRGDFEQAEHSLEYLNELERILKKKEAQWDRPPKKLPVKLDKGLHHPIQHNNETLEEHKHEHLHANTVNYLSNNPFASISQMDDDESSRESVEDDDSSDDEAGDQIVLNSMAMRRLMIRIVTCQSELFAHMSNVCRNVRPIPMWKQGSEYCIVAVHKIHQALMFADSEISRWLDNNQYSLARSELMGDAEIVEVAIQHLTQESDRFRQQAEQQKQRLMNRLKPQWSSRQAAKNRMGDRWYSNPAPKHDHYRRREMDERQLNEIQLALAQLQDLDTDGLLSSTKGLRKRLLNNTTSKQTHRYNGLRPMDLSRRVPFQDYPDPTIHGWIFTGSEGNKVEFFEKDGVKLDWYFTTGTIKTSLEHPTQGKTQLFASGENVSPQVYLQILLNPRAHTDVRYHTNSSNRQKRRNKKNQTSAY